MLPVVELNKVVKQFGNRFPALGGVDLCIMPGEIVSLLGPNGAGKTTLISLIAGVLKPTAGSISILGFTPSDLPAVLKKKISLVPQEIALYPSLTGRENLRYFGRMYRMKEKEIESVITYLEYTLHLNDFLDKKIALCSGGMKRRINLAAALLNSPAFIILDEPTVGIDVMSRSIILEVLKKQKENGVSVLYTSHQLDEAEEISDRMAILNRGKIIWEGDRPNFRAESQGMSLESFFIRKTSEQ